MPKTKVNTIHQLTSKSSPISGPAWAKYSVEADPKFSFNGILCVDTVSVSVQLKNKVTSSNVTRNANFVHFWTNFGTVKLARDRELTSVVTSV